MPTWFLGEKITEESDDSFYDEVNTWYIEINISGEYPTDLSVQNIDKHPDFLNFKDSRQLERKILNHLMRVLSIKNRKLSHYYIKYPSEDDVKYLGYFEMYKSEVKTQNFWTKIPDDIPHIIYVEGDIVKENL